MSPDSAFSDQVRQAARHLTELGVHALGGLYDLTSRRLVRYAVALTRNQHDAEDVVQTVLVRVAARPDVLAEAHNPWAYLLRMVRNEAIGVGRRRKRWSVVGNLTDLIWRRSVDQLEQEDTHRAVWQALRRLPPSQAEVVVLRIWEDMTFAQVGEVLEISGNTAASRYQYAMEKLSRHLAPLRREVVAR